MFILTRWEVLKDASIMHETEYTWHIAHWNYVKATSSHRIPPQILYTFVGPRPLNVESRWSWYSRPLGPDVWALRFDYSNSHFCVSWAGTEINQKVDTIWFMFNADPSLVETYSSRCHQRDTARPGWHRASDKKHTSSCMLIIIGIGSDCSDAVFSFLRKTDGELKTVPPGSVRVKSSIASPLYASSSRYKVKRTDLPFDLACVMFFIFYFP